MLLGIQDATSASLTVPAVVANVDPRVISPLQYIVTPAISIPMPALQGAVAPYTSKILPQVTSVLKPLGQVGLPEVSLQNSPAREEGEVPESELDPDTRRRLLILQHGQDVREHPPSEPQFPVRPAPVQVSAPQIQGRGSWFPVEEEMSPIQLNRAIPAKEFPLEPESLPMEKQLSRHPPFLNKLENSPPDRAFIERQKMLKEVIDCVSLYLWLFVALKKKLICV